MKAAAVDLAVNNFTVFRRINALEEKPAVRLFERLKTGFRLTDLAANDADIVIPAVNTQPDYMVGRRLAPIRSQLCATHS